MTTRDWTLMRILFTTESYYPIIDGGAIAQHRIVHELIKKGHDVRVIAPSFSFKNTFEEENGSTIYRPRAFVLPFYMNNKYHFAPFPLLYVKKIIEEFKPDIINVCSPYPISICAMICAKKKHIPLVGSIHILPENVLAPFLSSALYPIMEKYTWSYLVYFYNRVDWATIPTQTGATMYQKKGLKTPVRPISNGVNTEMFKPTNKGDYLRKRFNLPEKPLILYTGRINQEKNVDVLVKAIPVVLKSIDAHFLFCGSGGLKPDMMKLTQELGVDTHTTFIDFLDWADYPNIFTLADVFVMPAESELQSIVTLEAVASGVPPVVVNKGAVPELARAENGLVFEPQDSNQLASNIITILSDETLRNTMKKNSLRLSEQHSMNTVGTQYEEVYEKILEQYKNK
ncbi:D-inositol-3-phosphate glycosyltransferase [uncultured archaeon]|nr:D-inositol-3-phosphate glycosyltransferase [uncultured archaeon]